MKTFTFPLFLLALLISGFTNSATAQVAAPSYFQIYMEVLLEKDSLNDEGLPLERLATRVEVSAENAQDIKRIYLKVLDEEDRIVLDNNFDFNTSYADENVRIERNDKLFIVVFGNYDEPSFFKGEVYLENKEGQFSEKVEYAPLRAN